jgi:diguanylate cyclase (GGDEF)-like protein/PAS domain S-box-containing protein
LDSHRCDQPTANVLIVDNDSATCHLLDKALSEAGFQVFISSSSSEAFNVFLENPIGLVILDILLPEKDGFGLCADIRATEQGRLLPILMMAGSEDEGSIESSFQFGATDFILKPINHVILVHRVRYMLNANDAFMEWKKTEGQLSRLGRVLDNSSNEILFLDGETLGFTDLNNAALSNLGFTKEEAALLYLGDVVLANAEAGVTIIDQLEALINGESREVRCSASMLRKDGTFYPVEGYAYTSLNSHSGKVDIACIFEDITHRKQIEARMQHLAYYDSLTHLPNRELFIENFKKVLAVSERNGNQAALLFVDLDNFKYVNDTLGHNAGDALLCKIAKVLNTCIRSSDVVGLRSEHSLARFGGDEFAIFLGQVVDETDVILVAERILKAMSIPVVIEEREFVVTSSIGIVMFPEDGGDVDILLRKADIAMYEAKNRGRSGYQFYTDNIYARTLDQMDLEKDLRQAAERGELLLHYQPKYEISTGKPSGFEALLRWDRKGAGLVPPMDFIPLAEESNLIVSIGSWVIREACRQIREWKDQGLGNKLAVAVNLSSKQMQDRQLVKIVTDALDEFGLIPECLELEITETVMMENMSTALDVLRELKAMGCRVSLDDFGTGFSSLNYLGQFPLDVLKIDKSFIDRINVDSGANSIITAIVAMAKSLELMVVAEGVETEEQLAFIRGCGVEYLQGYIWSKPLSSSEVEKQIFNRVGELGA